MQVFYRFCFLRAAEAIVFYCLFFCLLYSVSEGKIAYPGKEGLFCLSPKRKGGGFPSNLFPDLSDLCKFSYRTVPGSGDSRKYVCHYIKYFENAICTFNWSLNCIYCINPCFWGIYRVRNGMFFDFYGESQTGNFVYCCISCFTAN